VPAFPTYSSTDPTLRITAVEHLDGVAKVYAFPYTPTTQEEAWIFEDLVGDYPPGPKTSATLRTSSLLRTVAGIRTP
jgi:hypothetical protein